MFVGRISPTVHHEYDAYRIAHSYCDELYLTIPIHVLVSDTFLYRTYLSGHTFSALSGFYYSARELQYLINNTRSMPSEIKNELEILCNSDSQSDIQSAEQFLAIASKWPLFLQWRNHIARFLKAPLKGESLKAITNHVFNIRCHVLALQIPFTFDTLQFLDNVNNYLQQRRLTALEFYRRSIVAITRAINISDLTGVYDIHEDNLLLTDTGAVALYDFECAGIGSSRSLLERCKFHLLRDIPALATRDPVAAAGWNRSNLEPLFQGMAGPPPRQVSYSRGASRVVLCSTATYNRIISIAKELVFFVTVMRAGLKLKLTASDDDIVGMPPMWQQFQKLKRLARGQALDVNDNYSCVIQLRNYILCDANSTSEIIDVSSVVRENIRNITFDVGSSEYYSALRILEYLRFVPFEIVLGSRVTKIEFDVAINNVVSGLSNSKLESLLNEMHRAIWGWEIPFHIVEFTGKFNFAKNMRRRIARKLAIAEKMVSKRAEQYLECALRDAFYSHSPSSSKSTLDRT